MTIQRGVQVLALLCYIMAAFGPTVAAIQFAATGLGLQLLAGWITR